MLTGTKVALRAIEPAHLPTLARWRSDAASYPYFHEYRPISSAAQEEWFARQRDNPDEMNFAVTTLAGELVGTIGLVGIDTRNRRAEMARVFIGDERARRSGYGREMTFLVLEYAFGHLNLHKVWCEVIAENTPARDLYRKFGFAEEGVQRQHVFKSGRYLDVVLMAVFAQGYRDAPGEHVRTCRAEVAAASR